jgi:transposase, IS5 family
LLPDVGAMMNQPGFFDVDQRLEAISAKGDPLNTIDAAVPWESFRASIEAVTVTRPEERKSNAGRRGYDTILKFKMLVLASLYNLSDESLEFQVRDRLSFMRFLGLALHDPVPDATTIWLFREELVKAGKIDELFELFRQHLEARGYIARGGQIIDASIVEAPRQRNTREENEQVKNGETRTTGGSILPGTGKRTRMRAGRRSMGAATSATRTTSASTRPTSSFASGT